MLNKLFFILCILLTNNIFAGDFTGKVISITDGDTVTVLTDNKQIKVRLAEIDTPEKNQPYGKNAKKALSDFILGKIVQIKFETIDRYGRTIGKIFLDNQNINKEMVKLGHAWVYIHYARDKTLFALEKEARENQLGLWALPEGERIAPWQWRSGKRSMEKESNLSFQCETKTTCRQMQSCAEAKYYLVNCGLMRLDGDKDGIPCESLCR